MWYCSYWIFNTLAACSSRSKYRLKDFLALNKVGNQIVTSLVSLHLHCATKKDE